MYRAWLIENEPQRAADNRRHGQEVKTRENSVRDDTHTDTHLAWSETRRHAALERRAHAESRERGGGGGGNQTGTMTAGRGKDMSPVSFLLERAASSTCRSRSVTCDPDHSPLYSALEILVKSTTQSTQHTCLRRGQLRTDTGRAAERVCACQVR